MATYPSRQHDAARGCHAGASPGCTTSTADDGPGAPAGRRVPVQRHGRGQPPGRQPALPQHRRRLSRQPGAAGGAAHQHGAAGASRDGRPVRSPARGHARRPRPVAHDGAQGARRLNRELAKQTRAQRRRGRNEAALYGIPNCDAREEGAGRGSTRTASISRSTTTRRQASIARRWRLR
ncbi:hypothetical protein AB5I41_00315 [Sphingomonas sp. MMS24-JH45]